MRDAIARTGQRLSAVELTHTKVRQSTWRERFAKSFERHRVTRFLKERAASIADGCTGPEAGGLEPCLKPIRRANS